VTGFAPSVSREDVRAYVLSKSACDDVKVAKLKTRFKTYTSFYLSVPLAGLDEIKRQDLWPTNSFVKDFRGALYMDQLDETDQEHDGLARQRSTASRGTNRATADLPKATQ
jgi:hypothetical protein